MKCKVVAGSFKYNDIHFFSLSMKRFRVQNILEYLIHLRYFKTILFPFARLCDGCVKEFIAHPEYPGSFGTKR